MHHAHLNLFKLFFHQQIREDSKFWGICYLSYHPELSVFSLLLTDTFCGWGCWSITKWPVSINHSPSLLLFKFIIDGNLLGLRLLVNNKVIIIHQSFTFLGLLSTDTLCGWCCWARTNRTFSRSSPLTSWSSVCRSHHFKNMWFYQCSRSGSGSYSFCHWLSRCRKI